MIIPVKEKEKLDDVLQVVQSSEELARKGTGSLPSVKTLLGSLGAFGSVSSIVSAIFAAIASIG